METTPKKKGLGCFPIGCFTIIILIVGGFFAGRHVLLKTSWPLKKVIGLAASDQNIEVRGISGSIMSGIGIEYFHFVDDNGNTNRLEGLNIAYDSSSGLFKTERFTLENIQVESAEFYIDTSGSSSSSSSGTDLDDTDFDDISMEGDAAGFEFIIGLIDIKNVTLIDTASDWRGEIGTVRLDGFELSAAGDPSMGTLTIASNLLDVSMTPEKGEKDSRLNTAVSIKTAIHSNVVQEITISGVIDLNGLESDSPYSIKAFDGKFLMESDPAASQKIIQVNGVTPSDYVRGWAPFERLTVKAIETAGDDKQAELKTFTFYLGETQFSAEPFTRKGETLDDIDEQDLILTSTEGDRCLLRENSESDNKLQLVLSTHDGATGLDALAKLKHGKSLSDLAPDVRSALESEWTGIVIAPEADNATP